MRLRDKKRGFTLVEIMVVIVVLTILAAAIIPNITGRTDEARVARARQDVANLETLLEAFRLDMMRYPTTEETLAVLCVAPQTEDAFRWKGPYLKKKSVPLDPWGHEYVYAFPGIQSPDSYDLVSLGSDGQEGGEKYARDITNWEDYDAPQEQR